MPNIIYKKSELKKMIGNKISDKELLEIITLVKPNIENIKEDNILIEHTADRPDLFGIEGFSRAIKNYLGYTKGLKKYSTRKPKFSIKINKVPIRPYVSCVIIRNIKMNEDFLKNVINIQEILNNSLGRKRTIAAIGIHDLDKIIGKISYAGVLRNEKMLPLEYSDEIELKNILNNIEKGKEFGKIIKNAKFWPVFKDEKGIISFPPIINSERTKITKETKNFFIEITGLNKKIIKQIMNILVTNFSDRKFILESIKLKFEKKSEITPDLSQEIIEVEINNVNKILGTNLSGKEIINLLRRMGYDGINNNGKLEIIIPCYRVDILHPIDIIEDVAIAYGYNNFKPKIPNISTIGNYLKIEKISEMATNSIIGFGFQEIIKSCLSNKKDQFEKMNLPESNIIEIKNPISSEYNCVRKYLIPGIMKFLSLNKHYEYPQNIFEIGDVVVEDKTNENKSRNERRIAGVICYNKAGFMEMKNIVESLMNSLDVEYKIKLSNNPSYIQGRGVDMYIDKKYCGTFGEIHPQILNNWEINMPVVSFEIILERIN